MIIKKAVGLRSQNYWKITFKQKNVIFHSAKTNQIVSLKFQKSPIVHLLACLFGCYSDFLSNFVGSSILLELQQKEMEAMRKQNAQLQKSIKIYLQEIERQKELNSQHESEIETLLKFNERLLGIIENELQNKKDTCSLQPISQRSERQSDLMGPAMNSLMRSKRLVAKSERGPNTRNSLVQRVPANKINLFQKEGQKSQINHSFDNDELSEKIKTEKEVKKSTADIEKKLLQSNEVRREMSKQISDLKKFTDESNKFYQNKISQIRNLSNKLSTYKPMEQLSQISQKLNLSTGAADMIKKVIMKNGN